MNSNDHAVMPGEQLRRARERQGVSLEEAARITCIGRAYIESLESDRYEELPSPAYVKGMIRSYARILDLPAEPLIAGYEQQGGDTEEGSDETSRGGASSLAGRPWPLLLIIGVIICAGYLFAQRDAGHESHSSPADTVMRPPLPAQGILPPRSSSLRPILPRALPVELPSRTESRVESTPAPAAKTAVLRVKVASDCFLVITVDDAPPQQYDLKSGDQVEWMGERYFVLEMTNAGAIDAELNGRPLPPLGKSGDAATVVVTAEGQIE